MAASVLAAWLFVCGAALQARAGGCPGAGNCCLANGSPGCDDATCCNAICAISPGCCIVIWDSFCALLATNDPVNCPQCQVPSTGACIFVDDFNSENGGNGQLDYDGFANWTVSNGNVDLKGNGFFDFYPGNGMYVDMDGSSVSAGTLTSITLSLVPDLYQFEFDLGFNPAGPSSDNSMTVSVGSFYSEIFVTADAGVEPNFNHIVRVFTVSSAADVSIEFAHTGFDFYGLIIDNIRLTLISPESGSAYLFDTTTGVQIDKLLPDDGVPGDIFGNTVAISGGTAIVGARSHADSGFQSGSAYLFDTTTGAQIAKLLANDGAAFDLFSNSVAISGATAIVGAPLHDDNGENSGSAYLFSSATGVQIDKLLPDDGAAGEFFGHSVAISGHLAVIGAYLDNNVNGIDAGSAYLFDTNTGLKLAKFLANDGMAGDHFGFSVAISGNVVVVGTPNDTPFVDNPGSAYVFVKPIMGWMDMTQTAKLTTSPAAAFDRFGTSVSISGDVVVVGANGDGSQSGSAYVFVKPRFGWVSMTQTATLLPDDGALSDQFGISVAISGATAIVGAIFGDSAADCNSNGEIDCLDIADGTSTDVNENGIPDECEGDNTSTTIDGLDIGETVIFNPGGGGGLDPTVDPLVEMTNQSGQDGASVTGTVTEGNLNPGAGGYAVFDTQLTITTTLADGAFFMRVMIPFDQVDLAGADQLSVDMTSYDPIGDTWVLTVQGNTVNSPRHPGPVGDRFAVEDTVLPTLSADLGDYGVYWNPVTLLGFAWANVDHTTDFAAGLAASPADITGPLGVPDGCVDAFDLGTLLGAWCSAASDPDPPGDVDPPCEGCTSPNFALADISGATNVPDGCVDAFDLAKLLAEWCSVAGGNPCGTCF